MLVFKLIAVFVMSAAIGVLYRVPRKVLIYGSLNGVAGWLITYSLLLLDANIVTACFCGSLTVGFLSEILARALRKPATVFIIPGFIPLVPGGEAYTTMRLLVEGKHLEAVAMGVQTLLMAGAIAFGIFVSVTAYRLTIIDRQRNGLNYADKD